jgi:hypothetical protein
VAEQVSREAAAAAAGASPRDDWAAETADRLDQLVGTIRSQTTDRIVSIARLLVYGLLAAIVGMMAAVLGIVMLVRFADEFIPQEVWLTYLVLGAIFLIAGMLCWSKREGRNRAA